MRAALPPRGDSRTFLTHFVGGGLDASRPYPPRHGHRIVPGQAHSPEPTARTSITRGTRAVPQPLHCNAPRHMSQASGVVSRPPMRGGNICKARRCAAETCGTTLAAVR